MTSPPSVSEAPGPLPRSPGSAAPPQRADHALAGKTPSVFAYAIRSGRNGATGPCVTLTVHVRAVELTHTHSQALETVGAQTPPFHTMDPGQGDSSQSSSIKDGIVPFSRALSASLVPLSNPAVVRYQINNILQVTGNHFWVFQSKVTRFFGRSGVLP